MALLPVFPLHRPISFLPQSISSQIGKTPDIDCISHTIYTRAQQPTWEKLAEDRVRVAEAKKKFSEINTNELRTTWKKWDTETIDGYRIQFRVIDINEDGLIDFGEFCLVMDEIGDTSNEEERKRYFSEVDMDQSDGIDFEEFLELIDRVQRGAAAEIGMVCTCTRSEAIKEVMRIGQLTVEQQIKYGLF